MSSSATARSFFWASRLALSRSSPSSARTISDLWSSSPPMNVSSWSITLLMSPSRPCITWVSSRLMVRSWATPPPLSSSDSALKTSSTSGLRPERASGITSLSPRRPVGAASVGASRDTNFSPSRLVWRSSATALSGSFTLSSRRSRTRAVQPSSQMSSTAPTVTSLTLTADCGTRSSTSRNSTTTR